MKLSEAIGDSFPALSAAFAFTAYDLPLLSDGIEQLQEDVPVASSQLEAATQELPFLLLSWSFLPAVLAGNKAPLSIAVHV